MIVPNADPSEDHQAKDCLLWGWDDGSIMFSPNLTITLSKTYAISEETHPELVLRLKAICRLYFLTHKE